MYLLRVFESRWIRWPLFSLPRLSKVFKFDGAKKREQRLPHDRHHRIWRFRTGRPGHPGCLDLPQQESHRLEAGRLGHRLTAPVRDYRDHRARRARRV